MPRLHKFCRTDLCYVDLSQRVVLLLWGSLGLEHTSKVELFVSLRQLDLDLAGRAVHEPCLIVVGGKMFCQTCGADV